MAMGLLLGLALNLLGNPVQQPPGGCVGTEDTGDHTAHAHYHGFERGPLKARFPEGVRGWCFQLSSVDVQGRDEYELRITSHGGTFTYDVPTNKVSGTIKSFRLRGLFTQTDVPAIDDQPARPKFVRIPAESLVVDLITTVAMETTVYGGKIIIPAGTAVRVTNADSIVITGEKALPQQGFLDVATTKALGKLLAWQKPTLRISPLPDQVQVGLLSRPGTITHMAVSMANTATSLRKGSFFLAEPGQYVSRQFTLRHARYGARITNWNADSIVVDVADGKAEFRVRRPRLALDFVAKEPTRGLPVLARGAVSAKLVDGVAPLDAAVMQVAPRVTGLAYQIASTTPSSARPTSSPRRPPNGPADPTTQSSTASAEDIHVTAFQEESMRLLNMVGPTAQQDAAVDASRATLATLSGANAPNALISVPYREIQPFIRDAIEKYMQSPVLADSLGRQLLLILTGTPAAMGLPKESRMILTIAPVVMGDSAVEFRIASGLTQLGNVDVPGDVDPVQWAQERGNDVAKAPSMDDVGAYRRKLPRSFTRKTALSHDWKDDQTKAVMHIRSDSVSATLAPQSSVILLDSDGVHVLSHLRVTWQTIP